MDLTMDRTELLFVEVKEISAVESIDTSLDPLTVHELEQYHDRNGKVHGVKMEPKEEDGVDTNNSYTDIKIEEIDMKLEVNNEAGSFCYKSYVSQLKEDIKDEQQENDTGNISSHNQSTHLEKRPYVCDVCNRGFTRPSQLIIHRRSHTGQKPYGCDVCNKSFTQTSHLITHKRSHTGQKSHVCDICQKGFTSSFVLKRHKRTHTKEKPYVCDVCDKGFNQPSNLIIHRRIHTGERPYPCDICNKRFIDSSKLARHKRNHTGEKPHECDVCNKRFVDSSGLVKHTSRNNKCAIYNKTPIH